MEYWSRFALNTSPFHFESVLISWCFVVTCSFPHRRCEFSIGVCLCWIWKHQGDCVRVSMFRTFFNSHVCLDVWLSLYLEMGFIFSLDLTRNGSSVRWQYFSAIFYFCFCGIRKPQAIWDDRDLSLSQMYLVFIWSDLGLEKVRKQWCIAI